MSNVSKRIGKSTATGVIAIYALAHGSAALAKDFTAGTVMTEMDAAERYTFLAGVIEGLAFTRFQADSKDPAGMTCIYDWFYGDGSAVSTIEATLIKYDKNTPGAVLAAMIRKRCG